MDNQSNEIDDSNEISTIESTEKSEGGKRKAKKKCKFFDIYIGRILKTIYDKYSINNNAKEQMNNILKTICKNIVNDSTKIMRNEKKKTLTMNHLGKSLKKYINRISNVENNLMLIWDIGYQAVEKYNSDLNDRENEKKARKQKADVIDTIIPPHLTEKYLRAFGNVLISKDVIIFFAACIDYIAKQILDKAVSLLEHCQKNRIAIKHLEIAIKSDISLSVFFERMNISLIGTPRINKISAKSSKTAIARYKSSLCMCKSNFEKTVREIIFNISKQDRKISKIVIILLQYYMEQEITELLFRANVMTRHFGKVKITGDSILLAKYLGTNMNNISTERYSHFLEQYGVGENMGDLEEEGDDSLEDNIPELSESFSFASGSEDGTEIDSE
jgi:histone H3/H4